MFVRKCECESIVCLEFWSAFWVWSKVSQLSGESHSFIVKSRLSESRSSSQASFCERKNPDVLRKTSENGVKADISDNLRQGGNDLMDNHKI